jgi:GNAT superfamily N-acetyltransferase
MAAVALRLAGPGDAGLIEALVREHAAEEGAPSAVRGSAQDYARAGFAECPFECLIAEVDGKPAGFALFFANFSSWEGRPGLFLEDLFVRRGFRGLGIGRRLVAELAQLVQARGGSRLDLVVADENAARQFYERLGLREVKGWLLYRADGTALDALAGAAEAAPGHEIS